MFATACLRPHVGQPVFNQARAHPELLWPRSDPVFDVYANLSWTLATRASRKFRGHWTTLSERQHAEVLKEYEAAVEAMKAAGCLEAGPTASVVEGKKAVDDSADADQSSSESEEEEPSDHQDALEDDQENAQAEE